ncbi:MAG: GNAT family N-acetyltransferase [Ferruginibacter sp.]|nr:GNAT family N-acetyltransferase [Ferruginibacter sp.]
MIHIVSYKDEYKEYIKSLNYEWLEKYFAVEENDIKQLSNPQTEILDKGGKIFFALDGNTVVATASLLKVNDEEYELAKMAVTEKYKSAGIGKMLMDYCIAEAIKLNAKKLSLFSNTKLSAAIHVYKKYGFVEIPLPEDAHYIRSNIMMEKLL